jgi:hypothetical protein
MKKLIALLLASVVIILSCAHQKDLSEEEKTKYHRAREVYNAGQRGGP